MNKNKSGHAVPGIVKWLLVVLFAAYIVSCFGFEKISSTSFEDMQSAVLASADLENMQEGGNQMFKRLYNLDPADYDGVCLWYPNTNMGAEELLLVKLKSTDQQQKVAEAVAARVESQIGVFEGYGIEQTEMLRNSVSIVKGNYVMLIVAPDTDAVSLAFENAY